MNPISAIVLNWNGKMLTPQQALVVERVAEQFSEASDKGSVLDFTDKECEGVLTYKGRSTIGTFTGAVFHVYLGTIGQKPWVYEFLMVDGGWRDSTGNSNEAFGVFECSDEGVKVTPVDRKSVGKPIVRK